MVAALCAWHKHHERAVREIDGRLEQGEALVVAAPALVETYAVLTRLPPPHRLSPADSWALLDENFGGNSRVTVALEANAYWRLLRSAPERSIAGGSLYDAVILACGLAAKVDAILTFNERQFRAIAVQGVEIVVPPAADAT
jgi:predicted nucleic acid-binding protein